MSSVLSGDTALGFLQRRATTVPIATGIRAFDEVGISGCGLLGGEALLITGPHGSGKTQIATHLCIQALTQRSEGAVKVIVYDCDGCFDVQRVVQMIPPGHNTAELLERLEIVQPISVMELALSLLSLQEGEELPCLLVVDGLSVLAGCDRGQGQSVNVCTLLKALCKMLVPVVVTAGPVLGYKAVSQSGAPFDPASVVPQPYTLAKQLALEFSPSLTLATHPSSTLGRKTSGALSTVQLNVINGRAAVSLLRDAGTFEVTDTGLVFYNV